MQWHLSRAGQVWGPYSAEALVEMNATGQLLPDDLVCGDGKTWRPVTEVVAFPAAPISTAVSRPRKVPGKLPGYFMLAAAAIVLAGAGTRLAMKLDVASSGRTDSVEKIEQRLREYGVPGSLAKRIAAGEKPTNQEMSILSRNAHLHISMVPRRLYAIEESKLVPYYVASFCVSLAAALCLAVFGVKRIRAAGSAEKRQAA